MAKYPGSVPVTGYIAPTDDQDVFAVTVEEFNKGGYRTCSTKDEMNSIPTERRKDGMLVFVYEEKKFYQLLEGVWRVANLGASEVDLSDYALKDEVPDLIDLSNYATKDEIPDVSVYALKDEIPDLDGYAKITDIPSLDNYATKDELPDVSEYVTKDQVDEIIANIPPTDLTDYYTKSDVDDLVNNIDIPDSYTKEEANEKFASKDDIIDTYTKDEIDEKFDSFTPEPGEGGDSTYTNTNPTTITVGGVASGTTFNKTPISEIFDSLFYPYQQPSFSRFSINNNVLEVGSTFNTPAVFSWGMNNSNNAKPETISIEFNGSVLTLEDNQKVVTGNNVSLTITPIRKDTVSSVSATIKCKNSKDVEFKLSTNVNWKYGYYRGTSTSDSITENIVKGWTKTLADNIKTTHNFSGSGYEYIVYPAVWGNPTQIKDNNGFGFAYVMLDNITFANNNGVSIEYKVIRSKEYLNSSVPMIIN